MEVHDLLLYAIFLSSFFDDPARRSIGGGANPRLLLKEGHLVEVYQLN